LQTVNEFRQLKDCLWAETIVAIFQAMKEKLFELIVGTGTP
jgi:hypothetical protein